MQRPQPALELSEVSPALEYDRHIPGGTVPHGAGAGRFPPALVARGVAVPTLASPGTPFTAATMKDRCETTHRTPPTLGTLEP